MGKLTKQQSRVKRHRHVRTKIQGTAQRPRLAIYRSLKHIYAQLIDDSVQRTLTSSSTAKLKLTGTVGNATKVGEEIAKLAKDLKITEVVFDRGGYKYHGQVKAIAEGARSGGLKL
ncbi:50S ribosomal protein L18 [candidate division Kazan bacterium RIFCSPHIGHO2_01_FULL_49_10]|uniref:Large ribosomal subunit protein uL18 n=1 Tax=candidate division Kazan bacterium RIFCSPLOWO2_01_FULL_48_13 TaxID=1798539 RepID=A0A1F4PP62_UNCK3|nr:MAG: 50S ribosomal protein L18 [candidate division Kazan bacterium RIFCSPHIGHO2_01_FULL_49_10]OGB85643.1 MAG: 50S ribosomal protein L18 [candidate division Kazan bacterium RIFCSPLOWO2_01_FULL_48_13]